MMKRAYSFLLERVPALGALQRYSWSALSKDAVAGVTVATVAIPQAMAYALIAEVPPIYGLYTAIVMTLVASLFDSSRLLVNGPTNAICIAISSAVVFLPTNEERIAAVIFLAVLVGLIQIAITLFRLGDLTRFVSHGVIVGFTLGAGILIILTQIKHLLGLEIEADPHDHFLHRFWLTIRDGDINHTTAALGVGTIIFALVLRLLKRYLDPKRRFLVPDFLLTIMAASLIVWACGWENEVRIVKDIPSQLPVLSLPAFEWEWIRDLSGSALAIAVLGLLEAIAMAKVIAAKTKSKLDINQQCLSEGVANLAGGFFQCFPGSGSLTRSAINQQAGAVSQWAAVISSVTVAVTVLLLARFAYYIPYAALAGLLTITAWRMVDRRQLLYHLRTTRFDAGIVLMTAFSAVFISIEFCILIGVFLSFVLYVPRAARLELTELTVTPERVIRERSADDPECGRMLIYNLEGELFFGSAPEMDRHLDAIRQRAREEIRMIVLRLKNARNPDAVCLAHVTEFVVEMQARRIKVLLCGVRPDFHRVLGNAGLADLLGEAHIFQEQPGSESSTLDAVRQAYDFLDGDFCSICPKRDAQQNEGEEWYYMI